MTVPALLLLASLGLSAYAATWATPISGDLVALGLICGCAALLLLIRAILAPRRAPIVLDGSNIMYWNDKVPSLDTVRTVANRLKRQGLEPVIWFDANVGYKVGDRYLGPAALAKRLGYPEGRVRIAPKGRPADPLLLEEATRRNARVVSNDRFRDWQDTFPHLQRTDFLVRMSGDDGSLGLNL